MKNIYKTTGTFIFLIIMIMSLSGCPGLFKDTEYCIIDNKSDYTIDVFVDNEPKNTVTPGTTYQFGLYTEQEYSVLCTSGDIQWGPKTITLEKGHPYTWTINNPEPLPQANITINNNSSWTVYIYIAGGLEGTINAGFSNTYTKDIGNYNLVATPQGINGSWQQNINLTEVGYIWDIESDIELYPSVNCRVWNFENNYEDHLGVDNWDYDTNTAFSSLKKKFGSYSLFANFEKAGYLYALTSSAIIGESQGAGTYNYIEGEGPSSGELPLIRYGTASNGFAIFISDNGTTVIPRIYIWKGSTLTNFFSSAELSRNTWNYIAFSYDADTNTIYLIANNIIDSEEPSGTWGAGNLAMQISAFNNHNEEYVDDISFYVDETIYCPNQFIDPQIFIDHYNHNVPWGDEYIP